MERLATLRSSQAVYLVERFEVPRPKALLGDQHLRQLIAVIKRTLTETGGGTFQTFRLAAAGSDSAVMNRLGEELSRHTGLRRHDDDGDLLVRLRRASDHVWEALIRLTSRPLATRAWRVCNYEGALNAIIARAMVQLALPEVGGRGQATLVNPCCGSGTLLIEAGGLLTAHWRMVGFDDSHGALACATANMAAARSAGLIPGSSTFAQGDAARLGLPDAYADALVADLPFGNLIGSHARNTMLYPAVLREAARCARRGARFVVLTNEARLMARSIAESTGVWRQVDTRVISQRGLHPSIYRLVRL